MRHPAVPTHIHPAASARTPTRCNASTPHVRIRCLPALIGWLIALCCPASTPADQTDPPPVDRMHFELLGPLGSLSQGSARTLLQDRRGFLWIGTQSGLNRFDGLHYRVFFHDARDPASIADDFINTLTEDTDGFLWVGTQNGLSRYDPATHRFRNYRADGTPGALSDQRVLTVAVDAGNRIWVGTPAGLDCLEGESFTHHDLGVVNRIFFDSRQTLWVAGTRGLLRRTADGGFQPFDAPDDPLNLKTSPVGDIVEDLHGNLWVTNGGALARIDIRRRDTPAPPYTVYRSAPDAPHGLTHNAMIKLHVAADGVLRVGTYGSGFFQYDAATDHFRHISFDPDDYGSLPNMYIFDIMEDHSGNLYFGTAGAGVARWVKSKARFPLLRPGIGPLHAPSHFIWAVAEDASGNLYLGSQGNGLYRADGARRITARYRHDPDDPDSLPGNIIRSLAVDAEDTLWVGSFGNGLCYKRRDAERFVPVALPNAFVDEMMIDSRGLIWLGLRNFGVACYAPGVGVTDTFTGALNQPLGLRSAAVNHIFEVDAENLWIAHYAGVDRLHVPSGTLSPLLTPADVGLPQDALRVRSIFEEAPGRYWLGTDQGLLHMIRRGEKPTYRFYTREDGLPDNVVYSIARGLQGELWLSTNQGLSHFRPQTATFTNYAVEDGLQGNEYNTGAQLLTSRGELAFCGVSGCNIFYPERVVSNPVPPRMVLTDITLLGTDAGRARPVTEAHSLSLSWAEHSFALGYAALEYTNPARNAYAYRLDGYDKTWIPAGTRTEAAYTRVPPGTYTFRVKGTNNDGVWSEAPATLRLIVRPPFWLTWWFRLLCVVLVLIPLRLAYRRLLRIRISRAKMESELATARDMQLGLMPRACPRVPGFDIAGMCRPADHVGGDYYDYLPMADGCTGIALVDVNTRAMEGAITTIMSSGLMHGKVQEHRSPALILSRMNGAVWRKTNAKTFVAMALAVIDPARRVLTFTNAGLPPMIVFRDGRCTYHRGSGPRLPLGAIKEVAYQEVEVPLQPDDIVVLFTDGLNEAMSPDRKPFDFQGIEATLAALPAEATARTVVNELLRGVQQHEAQGGIHDDVTLVVLRVRRS